MHSLLIIFAMWWMDTLRLEEDQFDIREARNKWGSGFFFDHV